MNSTTLNICPYCGSNESVGTVCTSCGGLLDPASRAATAAEIGPWFVRDPERPFFPGCSHARIKRMVRDQQLTRHSIVRGPTTNGFWLHARRVPGLAYLLGVCHACDSMVGSDDLTCPRCGVPLSLEHQVPASIGAAAAGGGAASALELIKRAQYQRIERLQSFVRLQAIALAVAAGGLFVLFVVYLTGLLEESPEIQQAAVPTAQTQETESVIAIEEISEDAQGDPALSKPILPEAPPMASDDSMLAAVSPTAEMSDATTDSKAVDVTLQKLKERLHDVSPEQAALVRRIGRFLEEASEPGGTRFERSEAIQRGYQLIDNALVSEQDEFMRFRLQALRGELDKAQARLDVEAALEE